MLNNVFDLLKKSDGVQRILQELEHKQCVSVYEIAEGEYSFLSAILSTEKKRPLLIVSSTDIKAAKLAKEINNISNVHCVHVPARDKQFSRVAQSQETMWDRLSALSSLAQNKQPIVCCSIEAACDLQCPKDSLLSSIIPLEVSDVIPPLALIEQLVKLGYERVHMVEGKGQCALRGDILDVFSPDSSAAARIEFFDDEIDTIRSFDCISQRSIKNIDSYRICPATECLLQADEAKMAYARIETALQAAQDTNLLPSEVRSEAALPEDYSNAEENLQRSRERTQQEAENLKTGHPMPRYQTFLHLLYEHKIYLHDYLDNALVVLIDPEHLKQQQDRNVQDYAASFIEAMLNGLAFAAQKDLITDYEYFLEQISSADKILFSDIKRGMGKLTPDAFVKLGTLGIAPYQSQIKLLIQDLSRYLLEEYKIFIFAGSLARVQRLEATLNEFAIPICSAGESDYDPTKVNLLPQTLGQGFLSPDLKLILIADGDIYGTSYKKRKQRFEGAEKIASYTELHHGDFVVHESYGIGVYKGIVNVERDKVSQDYLVIEYAGDDKLYVPTEQFDRVQKFASSESSAPKINKLGGTEWQRKKNRVKSGLKQLAFNLLELYAQRQRNSGFAFSKDNPWQMQFEDQFPYELTADQDKCVQDIYRDMESHRSMDRLLCGDVGYGKTELAMRAAFKAVCDNKQVAILAPTTILVQQHFQTIAKRFQHFPVTFGMLSRFKSAKEQKQLLADLAEGKIDIVVGTHRLLAKDVKYKNLGLLVVDEEQRFGVGHKEIIKNLKRNVDVLTLSATPIPRTLYMSMIGVRDISVIETPPEDRLPVKTYVVEYNDAIIRDAIYRELKRGGQIYFLYNKVESIDHMAAKLRALVPECRVAIAHGQMRESQLETTMLEFYSGAYDLLLCTTIIENGLDIPEANTIIIHDADRFGLSQLYQLRGRVGRSSRQAYAYFTIRPNYALSEVAQKRLLAIREFTEFGAGYRIAMRDLEIRGAGNIFGPEQSGHLSEIGFDMYLKLIEQALNEAQGKPGIPDDMDTRVDLPLNSYLPKHYVRAEKERIEIYKRIAMIKDLESRMDIEEELVDRYGNLPDEVYNLTLIAHLRACTRRMLVTLVQFRDGFLLLHMDPGKMHDPLLLLEAISDTDERFVFSQGKPYGIRFITANEDVQAILKEVIPLLEKTCTYIDTRLQERADQQKEGKNEKEEHA